MRSESCISDKTQKLRQFFCCVSCCVVCWVSWVPTVGWLSAVSAVLPPAGWVVPPWAQPAKRQRIRQRDRMSAKDLFTATIPFFFVDNAS